jgi:hypothetical protein
MPWVILSGGQLYVVCPPSGELRAISMRNPIQPAVYRYQQEFGECAYQQLLRRLFVELFPED